MATLHREADVLQRILTECEDDYVGLWSIYRQVNEAGIPDPKAFTLALIDFLLSVGALQAGMPDANGGFDSWNLGPGETLERIEKKWSSLGRPPDIGDIVWFTTPIASS